MNIQPITNQLLQKYLPTAKSILTSPNTPDKKQMINNLSKQQKILITKLIKNINVVCKMPKKQLVEFVKAVPAYKGVLGDLYFGSLINNYRFIVNQMVPVQQVVLHRADNLFNIQCYRIDYRIEFTISNIAHKKVMKPVVCLIFKLDSHQQDNTFSIYLSLQKFSQFRYKVAQSMKNLYSVEMRTLY